MGQEGVIKFDLRFTPGAPLPAGALRPVLAWRRILYLLQLIGRDPDRYGGLAYGNISLRLPPWDAQPAARQFAVSGTQTGGLPEIGAEHFALVTECLPEENRVVAEGPIRPSAEALTHGTLYGADNALRCVMHVHSPDLWRHAAALGLPATAEGAPYGSPEMAEEVRRLLRDPARAALGIFVMGGHEDGIVAFGRSPEMAGTILARFLALAFTA